MRAIAVVPVVLYHAGLAGFAGGYVGVDVFFVISGYLITTILVSDLRADRYSIAAFYERRARRILPALFVVLAACVALAWRVLLPDEMKVLGQGITAASGFAANIYSYAKGADYFGLQAEQNPVLHLWSLAVEEQFYLIFPFLLLLLWRVGRRWALHSIAVLALVSLAWSQYLCTRSQTAAFYMLPSRAWELLVGSALAFLPEFALQRRPRLRDALALFGLSMIVCAVVVFDRRTPFPGAWALLPTLGAALVIAFSNGTSVSGRLLGSKLPVGIGLVSFSLYLWHQPLFAFYRIWVHEAPSAAELAAVALLAGAMAYLSWRWVEQPFRGNRRFERRTVFALAISGSVAFAAFGIIGHLNRGYERRNPLLQRLSSNVGLSMRCNGNTELDPVCTTGDRPEVAILGNSLAMCLVDGFRSSYPEAGMVQLTQGSCEPHLLDRKVKVGKLECPEFLQGALSTIQRTSSIGTVFIASPFNDLLEPQNAVAFERTLETLRSARKRVVVVGPPPSTGTNFGRCFVRHESDLAVCDFDRARVPATYFAKLEKLRELTGKHGAAFLDVTDILCDEARCHASVGGTLIFRDEMHLSREGSRYLFRQLVERGRLSFAVTAPSR